MASINCLQAAAGNAKGKRVEILRLSLRTLESKLHPNDPVGLVARSEPLRSLYVPFVFLAKKVFLGIALHIKHQAALYISLHLENW